MNDHQYGPNPDQIFPNPRLKRICFVKNVVQSSNIQVGDYTYFDSIDDSTDFDLQITHHYEFMGDKLIIGKFCCISLHVEFVMNGINQRSYAFSSYPFCYMGGGWEKFIPTLDELGYKGDTVIGNDVVIGQKSTVMPGVRVGDGVIIRPRSVVWDDIPPYHIVAGNPAKVVGKRFDDEVIGMLLELCWWDWTPEQITAAIPVLVSGDPEQLRELYQAKRGKDIK